MKNFFHSLRLVFILLTLGLCAGLAWLVGSSRSHPSPAMQASSEIQNESRPVSALSPPPVHPRSIEVQPTDPSSAEEQPQRVAINSDRPRFVAPSSMAQRRAAEKDVELQKISTSLRDYRSAFNQNPVGNNSEISRVLLGKNSQGKKFLPDNAHLNAKGELTDRWDQPLFFHQISAKEMEVRSAGPDRKMWTADDEVLR
jgi:hypothetical protein